MIYLNESCCGCGPWDWEKCTLSLNFRGSAWPSFASFGEKALRVDMALAGVSAATVLVLLLPSG